MGLLKHIVLRLGGGLSTAAAIAVIGRPGVFLGFGLIILIFSLIVIVAMTGTFGPDGRREAAQAVLAILLGRDRHRPGGG
jgi:hypothetical protein